MNNFEVLNTPYTPGGASLVIEKIWSKIKQRVKKTQNIHIFEAKTFQCFL